MKKIIFILIMLNSLILFGQDREPSPWQFRWGDSDDYRVFQLDSFKQTSMFTGFQWAGSLEMNNVLLNNCLAIAGTPQVSLGSRVYPLNIIVQPTWWDRSYYKIGAHYSPFMQYEPTLLLNDTTEGKILRPADHSDPVFGFKHIKGTILNDSTNENYSRLILYKNSLPSYGSDSIVLKNIWPQPCFKTRGFFGDGDDYFKSPDPKAAMGQTDNYLGRIWFLTINLRRLNPATDNICDNSVVLSLQIPYKLWNGTTGLIKFDSVPISNINSVENLNYYENRGYSQLMQQVIPKPNSLKITRNMLPIRTDTSNITISAAFFTNGDPGLHNLLFSDDSIPDRIKDIDIVVKYHGITDIAVDFVRIESINARYLLRGQVDSIKPLVANDPDHRGFLTLFTDPDHFPDTTYKYIEQPNQIKGIIQSCLDTMKAKSHDWQDAKLFRFYFQDDECKKFYWWGPMRYCNKLTNGMYITRDEQTYPKIYEYYTKCPNRWVGFVYSFYDYHMPAPYIKYGDCSWQSMGLQYGYVGANGNNYFPNVINSDYETHIDDSIPPDDDFYTRHVLGAPSVPQEMWEQSLYESYYRPDTKLSEMLYSDKPWWLYHLLYNVKLNIQGKDTNIIHQYYRPKTGEEIRMLLNSCLIRGCKGFMYDGDENDTLPENGLGQMGIGDGFRISAENDFFSNWVGADYIDSINNTWNAFNYAKLDILANRMGVSRNKIYIGTRSLRTELFNFHSKIRRADEELMKLRLVASFSKGYRVQQNHHPDYPDDSTFRRFLAWDEVNNMVDTNRFKIRPYGRYYNVYQPDGELLYKAPVYEPWDSTFVDFTLLKDKDTSINDLAYIGILNRRTSPLVPWFLKKDWYYIIDPNTEVVTDSVYIPFYDIKFYSTAEFEDSCDIAKNPNTYQKFRDHWFNRLGCRTVTLPFNYINPTNPEEYALLRITELGTDTTFDSTWSYGRKMAFWNKIDTVIGQDRSITFNALPGEGKIFKIEVLHQDTTVTGILAHSNQSKLIMSPVLDAEGNETDVIRYHLVYFKPIVGNPNINGVYYRRSLPISKDSPEENIIWEPEILVSDSTINETGRINNLVSCDYPSIVVRKDSVSLKAYIVFSCFKSRSRSFVAETKLDVNTSGLVQDNNGYELALYNGNNRAEWGNPVVNASSNGNYYAWSDSTAGIVAAWKSPDALRFQANNKINFRFNTANKAQHPSLNVYSAIDNNEDNCALVWQESSTEIAINRILYTRLRQNGTSLYKYLSPTYSGNLALLDTLNNIASLIDTSFNLRFPVINRHYYNFLGLTNISELVYWGAKIDNISPEANYLMNCSISNTDINNIPQNWRLYWKRYIKSYNKLIDFPNISFTSPATDIILEDEISLNFKYCGRIPDTTSYIGHFNCWDHSYISSGQSDSTDVNLLWVKCIDKGTYPHLAKKKFSSEDYEYENLWQNRRVYQKTISGTNFILSSAKYFYKGRSDEMLADWYIGFETADSSKKSFLFGAPELDEQRFSLKLPFEKVVSDEGYISFIETSSDTIASSWFSIEDAKELALKLKGSNNANSKVYIQNKETERTLRLNLPNGLKENKGAKAKYNLINGLGNEFRLLFVKNDDAMQYTEELWIEGLPIEEKPAGSFKGDDGVENIDLIQIVNRYYSNNDISIFPNPASEVLYLQANVPFEEANLTVTNLLGTKVIQQQIDLRNSPELKLDISFLLPGMYYVCISTSSITATTLNYQSSISGKFLKR